MQAHIDNYFSSLKECIDRIDKKEIEKLIELLSDAKENGKQIFVMGNGGSASTASHFCCEFNKGASFNKNKRFKVICLNDSVETLLAYSNDICFEDVFIEQLKNFLGKNDIVIGISSSGNSKNILKAMEFANSVGAITVGLTGMNGGKLKELSQYSINPNYNDLQISEDIHMITVHILYRYFLTQD